MNIFKKFFNFFFKKKQTNLLNEAVSSSNSIDKNNFKISLQVSVPRFYTTKIETDINSGNGLGIDNNFDY